MDTILAWGVASRGRFVVQSLPEWLLELPFDRPRRALPSRSIGVVMRKLDPRIAEAVHTLSERLGLEPRRLLFAGYLALLYRYSGQQEVRVAVLTDSSEAGEQQIQVLCTALQGGPSFADLARQATEAPVTNEPYQVGFSQGTVPSCSLPCDLWLHLEGEGADLTAQVLYSTDLFDEETVARMLGHYRQLLESALLNPDRPYSELVLLTAEEQAQIEQWNATGRDYPTGLTITDLFERQVSRTPGAVALIDGEVSLTYFELNCRANRLAHYLRALEVGPEVLVGICMQRNVSLVVGLLAVLKAGAAYVPLDPAYPRERIGYTLADAKVSVLLTEESLAGQLPVGGARVVCPEGADRERIAAQPEANPQGQAVEENLAYVIYTSGSTGRPKGVAIEHRSAVTFLHWVREVFSDAELSGVLFSTSVCFDLSVYEVFGTLSWGGTLIVAENALALPQLAGAQRVRLINTVPSAAAELVRTNGIPGGVITINLAGESLPNHLAAVLYQQGIERVYNLYGPTEDTTYSTWWLVQRGAVGTVPIGRPLANTQVHLLDAQLRPVPVGVSGELYLSGAGLARGYLHRPDLTAEWFVTGPSGERFYRTGDLARYQAGGAIEYLGRIDHQVKIRGFRIEIGEIESVLAEHPGVQELAVVAREDEQGAKRLVAYVVAVSGSAPSAAELRQHLKQKLPEHMVPSAFVFQEALPLTPNGKVDRKALPAPDLERSMDEAGYQPPRTPLEEQVAAIFAEVLGLERVSVEDDFFLLGGHSLRATQVISRLREQFGAEVSLKDVFHAPTVAALAARVETSRRILPSAMDDLGLPSVKGQLPPSLGQEGIWLLQQLQPDSVAYNIPLIVRLDGLLDVGLLQRCLTEVVRRHEPLRSSFRFVDGQLVMHVNPSMPVVLIVDDLSGLPEEAGVKAARELAETETARPVDLERGPLFRVRLAKLAADQHWLLLNVHHIVFDGWSFAVLFREISELYRAFATGLPALLPEPAWRYSDYAGLQRERLKGASLEDSLVYWRQKLAGAPPVLDLPADRPRPHVQTYRGARQRFTLSAGESDAIRRLARQSDATLFMALLAGFKGLLARLSGQGDVVIGTPVAGRTRTETEGLIGLFVNNLVLRTDLTDGPSFVDLIGRVRDGAMEAFDHQELPFERLVQELCPVRAPARSPLFQVYFNMLNLPQMRFDLGGLVAEVDDELQVYAKYDLTLYVEDRPEGIAFDLVYNPDLFTPERMNEFSKQYSLLLRQATEEPQRRLPELTLVTEAAAERLPDPVQPLPEQPPKTIQAAFEATAARFPDRVAVADTNETVSYAELDRRSARLAHRLIELGIKPGQAVAIWAHRSASLVWAMLGILRAGGAFVTLDPAYPALRLLDCLQMADVHGLIQIQEAGPLPRPVADHVATFDYQVVLARGGTLLPEFSAGYPDYAPNPEIDPNQRAYIAFTSGTTGRPKGIIGSHGPVAHFVAWHAVTFGLGADDRFSMFSGLSHDPLLRDVFTPLSVGGTLCIPDPDLFGHPEGLREWASRERITVAHLTPAMGHLMTHGADLGGLPDLRYAFFGGDLLTRHDVQELARLAPAVVCVNFYGATETPQAMAFDVVRLANESGPIEGRERLPVGRGIDGVQLLVLTRRGRMAGVGEPGEVCIRTPYLSKGYLGEQKLTVQRFRSNPYTGLPHDRLYRTGDLGCYLPDGRVEVIGRGDRQVKIRGFRIELEEIEAVLLQHPAVRDVVAGLLEMSAGEKRLVVWAVVPGLESPQIRVREFIQERLPDYMWPAAIVALDAVPLTPNGKVNWAALPQPESEGYRDHMPSVGPRTPLEQELIGIWQEVLGVKGVGIHENFFALGGHSLVVTRIVSRIRQQFGVSLPLRAFFQQPTIAGLASMVEELRALAKETDMLEEIRGLAEGDEERLLAMLEELEEKGQGT